jgi:hypothetical protein
MHMLHSKVRNLLTRKRRMRGPSVFSMPLPLDTVQVLLSIRIPQALNALSSSGSSTAT